MGRRKEGRKEIKKDIEGWMEGREDLERNKDGYIRMEGIEGRVCRKEERKEVVITFRWPSAARCCCIWIGRAHGVFRVSVRFVRDMVPLPVALCGCKWWE